MKRIENKCYEQLYANKLDNLDGKINTDLRKRPKHLNRSIRSWEIELEIKNLPTKKSPDNSLNSHEFYQILNKEITPVFYKFFQKMNKEETFSNFLYRPIAVS